MNLKFIKLIFAISFAALAFVFYIGQNKAQAKSEAEPVIETITLSNNIGAAKLYKIIDGEYTCYLFNGRSTTMECVPTRN